MIMFPGLFFWVDIRKTIACLAFVRVERIGNWKVVVSAKTTENALTMGEKVHILYD
jgi:hypothetical protein